MTQAISLTTKDLKKGFGVGHMTIYNWRHGTATKAAIPHKVDSKGHVSFPLVGVVAWAKKHAVKFAAPRISAGRLKPGPKVGAKKKATVKKPNHLKLVPHQDNPSAHAIAVVAADLTARASKRKKAAQPVS